MISCLNVVQVVCLKMRLVCERLRVTGKPKERRDLGKNK